MKTGIILAIAIMIAASAHSQQKLKDLLYSGKLKNDSGSVVRNTDDLSTKIDTSTRKAPVETVKSAPIPVAVQDPVTGVITTVPAANTNANGEASVAAGSPANTPPKTNDQLWKDYVAEFTNTLKTDILPAKRIKEGTYSILIESEIDVDGIVGVSNVSVVPENSYLQAQVKERFMLGAPHMTPLLGTNGRPRKAIKKQTITVTK